MARKIKIKDAKFPVAADKEKPYFNLKKNKQNYSVNIDKEGASKDNYNILLNKIPYIIKKTKKFNGIYGMLMAGSGGYNGQWTRIDTNYDPIKFNIKDHGTWSRIQQVTIDGNIMTEIPITWVKNEILSDGSGCYWISDHDEPGFHVHPAFLSNGKATKLRIGSYMAQDTGDIVSKDGGADKYSYMNHVLYSDIDNIYNRLRSGYRLMDIYDLHFISRMMLTELGNPEIKNSFNSDYGRLNFHGIWDIYGLPSNNLPCWILGITTNSNGIYYMYPNNGNRTLTYTQIRSYSSQGYINGFYPGSCLIGTIGNFDFGDIFLGGDGTEQPNGGSFASAQRIMSDARFFTQFDRNNRKHGLVHLDSGDEYSTECGIRICINVV